MKRYVATIVFHQAHERFQIDAENFEGAFRQAEKRRADYYGTDEAELTCIKKKKPGKDAE